MKTKLIAIACAALAFSPLAQAEDVFTFEFDYTPTELATAEGRNQMMKRLDLRIERACHPDSRLTILSHRRLADACVDQVKTKVLRELGL